MCVCCVSRFRDNDTKRATRIHRQTHMYKFEIRSRTYSKHHNLKIKTAETTKQQWFFNLTRLNVCMSLSLSVCVLCDEIKSLFYSLFSAPCVCRSFFASIFFSNFYRFFFTRRPFRLVFVVFFERERKKRNHCQLFRDAQLFWLSWFFCWK